VQYSLPSYLELSIFSVRRQTIPVRVHLLRRRPKSNEREGHNVVSGVKGERVNLAGVDLQGGTSNMALHGF